MNDANHIAIALGSLRAGGAERAMIQLANGFNGRKIKTDLVVVEKSGEFVPLIHEGVNLLDLKKKRARNSILSFKKYLELNSPDVVIAAQMHVQLLVLLAVKISNWKGILILNEHSTFSLNNQSLFQKKLGRFLFPRADAVTIISNGAAADFAKHFPSLQKKISVIPNAVFTQEILLRKEENISHPFFENKKIPVIISAGRLTKSKNFILLIDAFALVLKQTDARLIVLGDGEEKNNLINYAADLGLSSKISFTGHVNNPYEYMNKCNLFALTSDYEGLPTVLIEALACGCNIVSTNCPHGPAEILENGKYGTLVPVNDKNRLAEAIIKDLSAEKNIHGKLAKAKEYHVDTITQKYLDLINNLKRGK